MGGGLAALRSAVSAPPATARPSHLLPVSQDLPESLEGKRAFLYREQGIGDEIRFATMVPDVVARGGEVTLEVSPKLHALFQRSFPSTRVVAGAVPGRRHRRRAV